jgi:hypothetical protein
VKAPCFSRDISVVDNVVCIELLMGMPNLFLELLNFGDEPLPFCWLETGHLSKNFAGQNNIEPRLLPLHLFRR